MSMNGNASTNGGPVQTHQDNEEKLTEQVSLSDLSDSEPMKRLPEGHQVDAIADLLRGGSEDERAVDVVGDDTDGVGDSPAGGGSDAVDEPLNIKSLADKLDMDPKDVYNLEVTSRDGDIVTLGNLKDAWQSKADLEQEIADKTDQLNFREAGIVSDVQGLGILEAMNMLPENVKAKANNHLMQMAEREYTNFLNLYPDMMKDENRLAFEKNIGDLLGRFGLVPEQFGVRTLGMYQLLKHVLDGEAQVAKLTKRTPKKPPQSVKRNRKSAPPGKAQPPRSGSKIQHQVHDIASIIGGKP